ncbi:hypothetical protein Sango_2083500 [Sesamum angolense]|uniref:C2 NT-type domain-containing protein n=1 Tax=Sesamum angolense TaxID=2727404 RepID=A0AAE1WB77_9LAMI|nr:hypothetical protein Sango_2083500 [Sesamum angolense]
MVIPQIGWDKLFISFIPADSGKATAKTTKANVRNGTCKWADPIYETTRLLQDSKSKQYDEKLYKIVVAMGSSRASTLGEATINLADYVDALKPSAVTLPLQGCNFGTILHITVQLLTSKTGFREFEQQRELRERGLQSGVDSHGHSATAKISYSEEVSARIKSKADANELSSVEEEMNLNEECGDSATGFDGSSNASESLSAEKHETCIAHEVDSLKSTTSGDVHALSHCQSPLKVKGDPSDQQDMAQSAGSAQGWSSNNSMDTELAMACEENNRLRGSLELAETSFFNLKLEVSSLQSVADELGAETQKFSHLLASEISSGEKLGKEVSVMKSECLKFKDEIIRLKDFTFSPQIPVTETRDNQIDHLVQNMQLQFLKGISVVEGKIRELQNKIYIIPHDGDTKFIYLELEALLNFLLDFKLENGDVTKLLSAIPSEKPDVKGTRELSTYKDEQLVSGNGLGLDLCQPESILQHFGMPPPVSEVVNPVSTIDAMKGQIFDLVRELDEAKVEKEALTRKMDQMECYYEALIQELEENQKRMLAELQLLRNEHSTCLYKLSASQTEMETLRQDMNQQMLRFVEERHELETLNKELEKRVTTSEAALRRARLNYSIAVDKLQKDLELLSSQVISMFETNENLIKQALPSQPESQEDLKLLHNSEDDDITKLLQFQNQNLGLKKRSVGGDILLEDLRRSVSLQEELYQKVEEELTEMYSVNLNLDIYSKALQESLHEAEADIRIMRGQLNELAEELKLSTASQNELMIRLQKATTDIHALNEYKSSSISRFSDMALQNQLLEDKLVSISKENYLLDQKLKECENTMTEYRSYQSKYAASLAENKELSLQLKQEAVENEKLANEMSLLKENLKILKSESDELISLKENLEEDLSFAHDKLVNLLESYKKQFCSLANCQSLNLENVDIRDAILRLEEIQHNACVRICQLMEENQNLESEKVTADVSLSTVRSEILATKQKFTSDIQDMVTKLDVSNALVNKLQAELESVASKIHFSSEIEGKYAQQSLVLLDELNHLEDQMQELTCKNGHFAQEILGLDALAEELGKSQLTITELVHDKQELAMRLQDKTEESIKLSCEVSGLKENLKNLNDELHEEKVYKDELEGKVRDLTSQLSMDQDKLFIFEQQKAELMHVRELASDLELEKSRLAHLLGQQNVFIEKLKRNDSYQASLESQLVEMHDYSVLVDVKLTYVANQYEALLDELLQKLVYSEGCLRELQKRYRDTEAMLNHCRASEANWREEKANLLTSLKSLRSDLEVSAVQNKLLSDSNKEITDQLEECNRKLTMMETSYLLDNTLQDSEVERLKSMMTDAEEEISYLTCTKEELEILVIVLKGKVDEQSAYITLLEEHKDELMMLRSKCNELSHKLSEQILKTEEFKNLSTHLKELKDKAEAECLVAREKRETEAPPAAVQDSLRIAFIKEQYETKIQELKQQLSMSKKHGEEMLLKLQDAIDEIENRKKSEAMNLKRNEELSVRMSALEAELQSALAEKREKSNAYDRTMAELECALLSLECCKEEKDKLGASLLEFEADKSRLATELTSVKGQLEDLKSSMKFEKDEYGSLTEVDHALNGSTGNSSHIFLEPDERMFGNKREKVMSILDSENADSTEPVQFQVVQDDASKGMHQNPKVLVREGFQQSNGKSLDVNDELGAQRLKSSIEHLHEELEKMKNENTIFDYEVDPGSEVPQREIMQLHKANEELRSMFPSFNEISSDGNALQRVLALEVELAEALRAKNKLSVQFQSSFLKQHSDEEAVFRSFRDINELIKEMLELKGRHVAMETELRDMHERYSRLSLQFAEVEGERQKLKMTLKNIRSSRKPVGLERSSSANVMDLPS